RQNGNRSRRAVLLTYVQILPSGAPPAAGLVLAPFRGLRYAQDRVSGLAEVTSPPYDVIAHDAEDHLLASDPHNIVRLILPRRTADNPGAGGNGATGPGAVLATGADYADAARLMRDWQDDGILVPDPLPALYVYEQSLPAGQVLQRGLIGALRLAPLNAGPVLPHEDVIPGPVAGRRQLMEATGANLEPIFLLYDGRGPGAVTEQINDRAIRRGPPGDHGHRGRDLAPAVGGDRPRRAGGDRRGPGLAPGPHRRRASSLRCLPATPGAQAEGGRRAGAVGRRAGVARGLDRVPAPDRRDPPAGPGAAPRGGRAHRGTGGHGARPARGGPAGGAGRPARRERTAHGVPRRGGTGVLPAHRPRPGGRPGRDARPQRPVAVAFCRGHAGTAAGAAVACPRRRPARRDPPRRGRSAARDGPLPRSHRGHLPADLSGQRPRCRGAPGEGPAQVHLVRAPAAQRPGTTLVRSGLNETPAPGRGSASVRRPDEEPVGALGQRHEVAVEVGRQLRGPRDPAALL